MSTEIPTVTQATTEIRTHYIDFTNDLPGGVTVISGVATHTPPSGGTATTPSVGAPASNVLPVTTSYLTPAGRHVLDVVATLSNGDKSAVRLVINVEYVTTRDTMAALIAKVRSMTDAGVNDYTIAGKQYWTDNQIQDILDRNRIDVVREELYPVLEYSSGAPVYTQYRSGYRDLEGGTVVFKIEDVSGTIGGYTMDTTRGIATFTANTNGATYWMTARSYDINAAACDIWREKAAHYAASYDVQTDGHGLKRSQLIQHCFQMAQFYATLARGATSTITLYRSDTNAQ